MNESSKCVNLNTFIELSNAEMKWVYSEILEAKAPQRQAKLIKHFIKIAKVCLIRRNYNSLFAIVSGLGYSSVSRLDKIWKRIPVKQKQTITDLEAIIDPSLNMKQYRSRLKSETDLLHAIPIMGVCIKDLYTMFTYKMNFSQQVDKLMHMSEPSIVSFYFCIIFKPDFNLSCWFDLSE